MIKLHVDSQFLQMRGRFILCGAFGRSRSGSEALYDRTIRRLTWIF